jgi:hypothetical protein
MKLSIQSLKKTGPLFNDNNIDPYIPEWWANETLAILEEAMVASQLVNRDFEKYFNKFGDVVNTRRPNEFEAKRKVKGDAVTVQDATADNVPVRLDQWNHVSFTIDDIEDTMSMKKLSDEYARPAAMALARQVDRVVLGQYPRFLRVGNMVGKANGITKDNIKDYVLDLGQLLDDNKCYDEGRNVILTSKTNADMLRPEWFTSADKVGDRGEALRRASLGQKLNFDWWKAINMSNVAVGNTVRTFQVNNAAGYDVGTTALTVDTGTGEITVGTWVSIDGLPYQVTARTGTAPTTAITLAQGLKRAVVNDQAITVYTPGAVNNVGGYAQYWSKQITVDGFSVAPRVGQFVSFGTDTTNVYTIIGVSGSTGITLDRALEAAIADDATVNIGPAGAYNLALHKDAITLAIRGLQPVRNGAGALSTTMSHNGLSMRVTISYDATYQKHMWTFDFLSGIQVLDTDLGAVLCG